MSRSPGQEKGIDLNSAIMEDLTIHQNVRQELIFTTVDKLKICLMEHRDRLIVGKEWVGMVGLCLSLVGTLVAATFQDKWLLAATWEALYILCAAASGLYAVVLIVRAVRAWRAGGIDALIDRIAQRAKPGEGLFINPFFDDAALANYAVFDAEEDRSSGPLVPKGGNE